MRPALDAALGEVAAEMDAALSTGTGAGSPHSGSLGPGRLVLSWGPRPSLPLPPGSSQKLRTPARTGCITL
eukprot:15462175-Alexandrium_andersonii.AAC.1